MNPVVPAPSRWAQAWDRVSLYLPVLLMGLLAMGSYWLVQTAPRPDEPAPPAATHNAPDYFMRDFAVRSFHADGTLQHELRGAEIRHLPLTNEFMVQQPRLRSIDPSGQTTTAQGRQLLTNDAHTLHHLQGDVIVVRVASPDPASQRLEFRGQALLIHTAQRRISSNLPIEVQRGPDRLSANAMAYDEASGVLQLDGRVRASFVRSTP